MSPSPGGVVVKHLNSWLTVRLQDGEVRALVHASAEFEHVDGQVGTVSDSVEVIQLPASVKQGLTDALVDNQVKAVDAAMEAAYTTQRQERNQSGLFMAGSVSASGGTN